MAKIKKQRRRPPRPMPERIDASPERIAEVVLRAKPKTNWRYTVECAGAPVAQLERASPCQGLGCRFKS